MSRLVVIGDCMLDVDLVGSVNRLCPDAPVPVVELEADRARPGGAGLAALLVARRGGGEVTLVTALGRDDPGAMCSDILERHAVEVIDVGGVGATPQKMRVWSSEQVMIRLDRGTSEHGPPVQLGRLVHERLADADGIVVADYGRGVTDHPVLRRLLLDRTGSVPLVWDPHPRGRDAIPGCWLVTPNAQEAMAMMGRVAPEEESDSGLASLSRVAGRLVHHWSARAVAVTLGAGGAVLATGGGAPLVVPAPTVTGDTCGAGDQFAVSSAWALVDGALLSEAVEESVRDAAAFVAAGGASSVGSPPRTPAVEDVRPPAGASGAVEVVQRTRRHGGTVVATGGCFDLLHAGHVRLLEQARALGDCLVVCLNSDRSVRRLKGPDRPVVSASDRAQVLTALASVDAVIEFDDDTPSGVLSQLQPDLFVKGADYSGVTVTEQSALDQWGGQVVVVPYLPGRSTTRLLEEVFRDG